MGLECETIAKNGKLAVAGKLHLDSKQLSFRSSELKFTIELGPNVSATAKGSSLLVSSGSEQYTFQVGKPVDRWVRKILNPPTRVEKLGIKDGSSVWVSKGFDRQFRTEIKNANAKTTRQLATCDLALVFIASRVELGLLIEPLDKLPDRVNIWVVWPKGSDAISQSDVMNLVRASGFGPSKTAAFDDQKSSMRFARKRA